jgi:hypothetical protein
MNQSVNTRPLMSPLCRGGRVVDIRFGVRRRRTAVVRGPPIAGVSQGAYGTYCSAIFTTWSWRTVTQNGPAPPRGSTIASLSRGTRTFLVALPV